ncbi:uncharacterized protein LOC124271874 isoform X9 [Haliotis rubra]|uniref:uncharacterized protein LOC124271874 isoform X9 n=1 Tax=Haliotis rubra TaxID=36100 RepID=UPI001EE4FBAC|nr:uncharacterized protein LOC124271874 isoform X9 [Haliotis rubra]
MWRKYLLLVTLTLCVISDGISGRDSNSGPRRGRLMQLDYRRDFIIGPDETDFTIGPDERAKVSPILLSQMCAYCRQQGNQPCIDRICSRTTVERGSAVA